MALEKKNGSFKLGCVCSVGRKMASLTVAKLSLGDIHVSPKGGKSAPLLQDDGPIFAQLPAMGVLFEPKSFDGAESSRVSMCMRTSSETVSLLREIDQKVISLAAASSVALFGKELTSEQVTDRYVSSLKEGQYPLFRAKLNLAGTKKTRLWSKGQRCEPPEFWQGCTVTPIVHLKGLWLAKSEFGPVYDLVDVNLEQHVEECPFR